MRHASHATWPRLAEALRVEWTKLRTLAGTAWLCVAVIALTVALGVAAAGTTTCPGGTCGQDPAKVSLTGIAVGQAVVAVLAVLAISEEYGTGMIRLTFAAMPRRTIVLAAKAVVVGGLALVAGAVAVLTSILVGQFLLPGNGFITADGSAVLSLRDGPVLRAVIGSVLYLVLIGLISLGVAAAVRDSATAIGIVLGLLYLFPIVSTVVADPDWYRLLQQIAPMTAGQAVQATIIDTQPLAPWAGLGVVAAWAAGALLVGGLTVRLRDA